MFVTTGGAQIVTLTWEFVFKATVAELSFLYNFTPCEYVQAFKFSAFSYGVAWLMAGGALAACCSPDWRGVCGAHVRVER